MNYAMLISIVTATLASFLAVKWIYFKVLQIALVKKLVDNPDARKLQKTPIPVMGGIAVFFGMLAGVMVGAVFHEQTGGETSISLLSILCGMMAMLYVGAMDDVMGLSPKARFVIEILVVLGLVYANGMCIDNMRGLWGVGVISWWIAVPLTVFAGVGIINAINLIDGVNGLSSGLCITYSVMFGLIFINAQDVPNAVLAFSMAASLLPFFIYNVFGLKSRMFIGDAGTMMMGILMTWFVICVLSKDYVNTTYEIKSGVNFIALALAIMSVPIADTLRVMSMRMLKGKSPFQPDKTHMHHAFVNVGVSHFITAVSMILIDIIIVMLCWWSVSLGASKEVQLYVVILSSMVLVWGTYALLRYNARNHTEFLHWLTGVSVRSHLGRTEWWKKITEWLDAPGDYSALEEASATDAFEARAKLDEHMVAIDQNNYKELDRKKILDYMRGKAEVHLNDIVDNSGAEKLRVYPILFEEVNNGYVRVVKSTSLGTPLIVALVGGTE